MAKFMAVVKNIDTYATPEMKEVGLKFPRLGLGVMGLHNWLLNRGYDYNWNDDLYSLFDTFLDSCTYGAQDAVNQYGFNEFVSLIAQAPTGSISRLAGGISGGIEPIYSGAYKWRYQSNGIRKEQTIIDPYVLQLVKEGIVNPYEPFKDALSLATPDGFRERVYMQSMIQRFTDNAISSTINLPKWGSEGNNESTLEYYRYVLLTYLPKLRGITVYPDGCRSGQPLTPISIIDALNETGLIEGTEYSNCSNGLCAT